MDEAKFLELVGGLIRSAQNALRSGVSARQLNDIKTRLGDCISDLDAMSRDAVAEDSFAALRF